MSDIQIQPLPDVTELYRRVNRDGLQAHAADVYRFLRSALPSAPQASKKPLFGELIAQHEGLAEELKTIDAEVDRQHGQASVVKHELGRINYMVVYEFAQFHRIDLNKTAAMVREALLAYTHPAPVREPLSDKQREAVVAAANATLEHGAPMSWEHALIDAVEAAHGITKDKP